MSNKEFLKWVLFVVGVGLLWMGLILYAMKP